MLVFHAAQADQSTVQGHEVAPNGLNADGISPIKRYKTLILIEGKGAGMRTRITIGMGLLLAGAVAGAQAQDVVWHAAKPAPTSAAITLGQPSRLSTGDAPVEAARVVRGQINEPPPPPIFP